MTIQSQHIDNDLSNPPPGQGTGWIEQSKGELAAATRHIPYFSSEFPELMVPESQWKERALRTRTQFRESITKIYSQGNEGSCVGFGAAQMLETTLRRRYGLAHWVSISGMSVYKRIGRSSSSGAYIPDGIEAIVEEGALPDDSAENKARYAHTHPRTGFSKSLPSGWEQTAKLFRGSKWAQCNGKEEVASALLNGYVGIVGRSGHCIPYVYLDFSGNDPVACYANSWDVDWSDNGFGYDSVRTFSSVTLYVLLDVVTRPELLIPTP